MKNSLGVCIFFTVLIIGVVMISGCTNSSSTNTTPEVTTIPLTTPQIQQTPTVIITTTVAPISTPSLSAQTKENIAMDMKFLNFLTDEGIFNTINVIEMSAVNGACDTTLAMNLNKKLVDGPKPGSPKLIKYRAMLMDSVGQIDGSSNDLSQLRDGITKADVVFAEYRAELEVTLGVTPTIAPSIDIDVVLKKAANGANVAEIINKMKDKHSFTVKYDVYKGQIKTSNEQQATPDLLPGETAQVTLYCSNGCTGVSVTGIEIFNETSGKMEEVMAKYTTKT